MSYVTRDDIPTTQNQLRLPVPFLRKGVSAGDLLATMTQAVGIQDCSPCEERRRWLNERLAFRPWSRAW